jgi:hypothetical protein
MFWQLMKAVIPKRFHAKARSACHCPIHGDQARLAKTAQITTALNRA